MVVLFCLNFCYFFSLLLVCGRKKWSNSCNSTHMLCSRMCYCMYAYTEAGAPSVVGWTADSQTFQCSCLFCVYNLVGSPISAVSWWPCLGVFIILVLVLNVLDFCFVVVFVIMLSYAACLLVRGWVLELLDIRSNLYWALDWDSTCKNDEVPLTTVDTKAHEES